MTTPFRFAHISDSHLGYRALNKVDPSTNRNQRTVDVEHAFVRMVDDIIARRPDGVIHSGDLFHHSRPTWQSLRVFIRQFRRLEHAGIPTVVIAGNHDTPRIRTGGSAYSVLELALPETTFLTGYLDESDIVTFAAGNVHIHAIPHGALTNPDPVSPRLDGGRRNVMVVHGTVPGILPAGLQTEPGEQELDHLLLDERFDYIALGHIHQAQQVQPNAWYAGSIERCGWGDVTASPGYLMVTLGDPGTSPEVEHIPLPARPMIGLRAVQCEGKSASDIIDEVMEQARALDTPEAMTRVDLRGASRPIRREAHSGLRRASAGVVWSLDLVAEKLTFIPGMESSVEEDQTLDLHVLFHEFVTARKDTYPSDAFAAMLLERGSQALTDAMVSEADPLPEDDVLA